MERDSRSKQYGGDPSLLRFNALLDRLRGTTEAKPWHFQEFPSWLQTPSVEPSGAYYWTDSQGRRWELRGPVASQVPSVPDAASHWTRYPQF